MERKMEENKTPEWNPEPFPEPRTIPSGWVTGFEETHSQNAVLAALQANNHADWQPEAFSQPRTFPSGWNFAAIK
jgi:hypothetical protein